MGLGFMATSEVAIVKIDGSIMRSMESSISDDLNDSIAAAVSDNSGAGMTQYGLKLALIAAVLGGICGAINLEQQTKNPSPAETGNVPICKQKQSDPEPKVTTTPKPATTQVVPHRKYRSCDACGMG